MLSAEPSAVQEQLDKAAAAMEELRKKLSSADEYAEEKVQGVRAEARQQRQALVASALSSMSHLRNHLIYSLTGLRQVINTAASGESSSHFACDGTFAVGGSRAPYATRGSTTRLSAPQRSLPPPNTVSAMGFQPAPQSSLPLALLESWQQRLEAAATAAMPLTDGRTLESRPRADVFSTRGKIRAGPQPQPN